MDESVQHDRPIKTTVIPATSTTLGCDCTTEVLAKDNEYIIDYLIIHRGRKGEDILSNRGRGRVLGHCGQCKSFWTDKRSGSNWVSRS